MDYTASDCLECTSNAIMNIHSRNIIASIVWLSGNNVYITRIKRGA